MKKARAQTKKEAERVGKYMIRPPPPPQIELLMAVEEKEEYF